MFIYISFSYIEKKCLKCSEAIPGCLECGGNTDSCSKCNAGFVLNAEKKCSACSDGTISVDGKKIFDWANFF